MPCPPRTAATAVDLLPPRTASAAPPPRACPPWERPARCRPPPAAVRGGARSSLVQTEAACSATRLLSHALPRRIVRAPGNRSLQRLWLAPAPTPPLTDAQRLSRPLPATERPRLRPSLPAANEVCWPPSRHAAAGRLTAHAQSAPLSSTCNDPLRQQSGRAHALPRAAACSPVSPGAPGACDWPGQIEGPDFLSLKWRRTNARHPLRILRHRPTAILLPTLSQPSPNPPQTLPKPSPTALRLG